MSEAPRAESKEIDMAGIGGSAACVSGVGAAEEALIVIGLGRRLVAPAVLATIGVAHARLATGLHLDLQGRRVAAAYRRGERVIIVEEAQADLVLVREHDGASLYDLANASPGVERRWLGQLRSSASLGEPIARFDAANLLLLRLIDAAALAGIAEATLDMSVAYAGLREQRGRLVGSFQAVNEHCANMALAARCARDQIGFAAVAIDEGREDAALQVETALFVCGSAALENAARNIRIHGADGLCAETDPQLYLQRARLLMAIAGGSDAHRTAHCEREGQ